MDYLYHKYLGMTSTSNSINQLDKMDKYYLLGPHNNNLRIHCILDLCMINMMDSILIQKRQYFQEKQSLNFYQSMQNSNSRNFVMILKSSKFQLQMECYHKILCSLDMLQAMYRSMNIKIILFQIQNFQIAMYHGKINPLISTNPS
ncbi:unnamed protein product [Paramecium octaurelia]|uniref:Uncharacterized protein n=1 Tax=Paramecium octaurelia TaxID=43137 RepID=A0A8S1XJH4_PAROT|nr:unnamed protein product [Paramecium octaurelia]